MLDTGNSEDLMKNTDKLNDDKRYFLHILPGII